MSERIGPLVRPNDFDREQADFWEIADGFSASRRWQQELNRIGINGYAHTGQIVLEQAPDLTAFRAA
jgi:hypothetical protein